MKYLLCIFSLLLVLLSLYSCEPEEEILTRSPKAALQFSTDSLIYDTVFVKTGSVTKRVYLYNYDKNAVQVDEIKLGRLGNSAYRVIINGVESPAARNIRIRGGDSLLVLVKVFIQPDNRNTPFLVKDSLVVSQNNNVQDVKLVAYGQDAYFYRDQELACNSVWKADKPHVIYDRVIINKGCTLTIEKGARIYAHKGAGILVDGSLRVEGTAQERVVFTGDRLEKFYEDIPGQWSGIRFFTNSKENVIRYADIRNAQVGIWAGSPDRNPNTYEIKLEQCTIQNMYTIGILSYTTDIQAINTLISNCGQHAVAGFGGGTYDFKYCTIANYTPDFRRDTPSFAFTDRIELDNGQHIDYRVKLSMVNSIVWAGTKGGKLTDEILFRNDGNSPVEVALLNNILQTERYKDQLDKSNIINQDPRFRYTPESPRKNIPFDYTLDTLSVANGGARPLPTVKQDLKDLPRDNDKPDIGAYERLKP
ncbi:MAG: hypothetical protein JWQ14_2671 [Adhaeribacter sp.]|nr:hypothetical protein [Adhaeribacter sp.]